MAYGFISHPGTEHGPCAGACFHRACAASRATAETPCKGCNEPIGYKREFTYDDDRVLWHFWCLVAAAERATRQPPTVTSGPQLCTVCRREWVDTDAGFDTCARCARSI